MTLTSRNHGLRGRMPPFRSRWRRWRQIDSGGSGIGHSPHLGGVVLFEPGLRTQTGLGFRRTDQVLGGRQVSQWAAVPGSRDVTVQVFVHVPRACAGKAALPVRDATRTADLVDQLCTPPVPHKESPNGKSLSESPFVPRKNVLSRSERRLLLLDGVELLIRQLKYFTQA